MYSSTILFHLCRYNQPRQRLWTFLIFRISSESSSAMLLDRRRWCCRRYLDNSKRKRSNSRSKMFSILFFSLLAEVLGFQLKVLRLVGDIDICFLIRFRKLETNEDISVRVLLLSTTIDCNCTTGYIRSKLHSRFQIRRQTQWHFVRLACKKSKNNSKNVNWSEFQLVPIVKDRTKTFVWRQVNSTKTQRKSLESSVLIKRKA